MSRLVEWDVTNVLQSAPIAILILNQPIACEPNLLLPLWQRAEIRLTVDGGSNRWREFVEKLPNKSTVAPPHCMAGDLDSIDPDTKTWFASQGVALQHLPDQDETDFTKALRLVGELQSKNNVQIKYVVCVCENAGRLDQTLGNLETLHHAANWNLDWRAFILTQNTLTWLLEPGAHVITVPPVCVSGTLPCGLIPLKGRTTLTTKGLKWDLENGDLEFGRLVSTSNTFQEQSVSVTTSLHLVWTMQFLPE